MTKNAIAAQNAITADCAKNATQDAARTVLTQTTQQRRQLHKTNIRCNNNDCSCTYKTWDVIMTAVANTTWDVIMTAVANTTWDDGTCINTLAAQ